MVFERITFDVGILGGRACIRGMRIPVSVVLAYLAEGVGEAGVLREYPALRSEDVQEVLEYAAWLAAEDVREQG